MYRIIIFYWHLYKYRQRTSSVDTVGQCRKQYHSNRRHIHMRYAHSHYQQISKPYTHIQGVQSYSKAKTAPCPGNLHTFETVLKMIQILFCSISSKYSTVSILRSYFLNYFFHNIVRALCLFIWLIICIHGLILPGYVLFF